MEELAAKRTWKKEVVEESMEVVVSRDDVFCLSKWNVGGNQIAIE